MIKLIKKYLSTRRLKRATKAIIKRYGKLFSRLSRE